MGLFAKKIKSFPSFGGGLTLPSSIKFAREARKHYRRLIKKRGVAKRMGVPVPTVY